MVFPTKNLAFVCENLKTFVSLAFEGYHRKLRSYIYIYIYGPYVRCLRDTSRSSAALRCAFFHRDERSATGTGAQEALWNGELGAQGSPMCTGEDSQECRCSSVVVVVGSFGLHKLTSYGCYIALHGIGLAWLCQAKAKPIQLL